MNDPESERTLIRRDVDHTNRELLILMQRRIDTLEEEVRHELSGLDARIQVHLERSEARVADTAIKSAVSIAFGHLGVDVNDPHDLQTFRDDVRYGGYLRSAFTRGMIAFLLAICGAMGLSFWMVIKNHVGWRE
jgi:hypothetical protein